MTKKNILFFIIICFLSLKANASFAEIYCESGTLIFKEDFGGNSPLDSDVRMYTNPQIKDYTFTTDPRGPEKYSIRKKTQTLASRWFEMDDHTHPEDQKKGYLMQVDASYGTRELYAFQLNNLCPETSIFFSVWAASVSVNNLPDKAKLRLLIQDLNNKTLHQYDTENLPDGQGIWMQYGTEFVIPEKNTSLIFRLLNLESGPVGNDFVIDDIEVRLCTPQANVAILPQSTICEGFAAKFISSYKNDSTMFPKPITYVWQKNTSQELHQWEWKNVAEGESFSIPSLSIQDEGYYRMIVANPERIESVNCRVMSDPVFLKVNPCNSSLKMSRLKVSKDTVICKGQTASLSASGALTYRWIPTEGLSNTFVEKPIAKPTKNTTYFVTGTFADGKTETKSVNINVCEPKSTIINKYICDGDHVKLRKKIYNKSGTYKDTLIAKNGCDSIITLNLTVGTPIKHTVEKFICRRNYFIFGKDTLKRSGTYTKEFKTKKGCDSIVTLNLTVESPIEVNSKVSICKGETYQFGDRTLSNSGIYFDTFNSISRCDSNVTLYLDIIQKSVFSQEKTIYDGRSFSINGKEYTKQGIYVDNLRSAAGCDSLVITNLKVLPSNNCPDVVIPDFFSPNDDGLNDLWEIQDIDCYLFHEVEIYNETGKLLLRWENDFKSWDGTYIGEPLPSGTYVYNVKLGHKRGDKKIGKIELMRD